MAKPHFILPFITTILISIATIFFLDVPLQDFFKTLQVEQPDIKSIFKTITTFGGAHIWLSIIVPLLIVERIINYRQVKIPSQYEQSAYGLFLLLHSFAISGLVIHFLKFAIGRFRPAYDLPFTFDPFSFSYQTSSLPSGHTQVIFTLVIGLLFMMPKKKVLQYGLIGCAILVESSRLVVGRHYLSDIIMGGFLGGFVSYILFKALWKNETLLTYYKERQYRLFWKHAYQEVKALFFNDLNR